MDRSIIELLQGALDAARLERSEFGQIFKPREGESVPYPQNENEVTAFIKDRVKLHHNSWIVKPIEEVLKLIGTQPGSSPDSCVI